MKQSFSQHLFWDVDEVDWKIHRDFIIVRVMERGTLEDVRLVWDHYGVAAVKAALLKAPSLQKKTLCFFANQFGLKVSDFRADRKGRELNTWGH
ncbi:hypothetical protein [Pontiella sp.]|uniref:DUF6922 domain-containing protein n=1 Tax=Pontiella sp. TaxID=2837462 RepID=UPI00356AC2E9